MMSKFPGNAEPQLGLEKEKNQRSGEWFSRGYLPHCNKTAILQAVTFRLADSLPQEKLRQLREEKEAFKKMVEQGLGVPGKSLWMREYWDRFIRNEQHLMSVIEYIHNNPVKAGLCNVVGQWRWSSASKQ
jgi:REP element-mobilizing transposase RayT